MTNLSHLSISGGLRYRAPYIGWGRSITDFGLQFRAFCYPIMILTLIQHNLPTFTRKFSETCPNEALFEPKISHLWRKTRKIRPAPIFSKSNFFSSFRLKFTTLSVLLEVPSPSWQTAQNGLKMGQSSGNEGEKVTLPVRIQNSTLRAR